VTATGEPGLATSAAVRGQVRAFLEENFDRDIPLRSWLEGLADSGWASPQWPAKWFGKGLPSALAAEAFDEFRKAGAPGPPAGLGRMLAAPTIIAHGTEKQRQRLVRRILIGEDAWCQLFSEPGAGSDLASLQTRAELDGEEYVVNGQKVWTSGASVADLGMLLTRTEADVLRHRGITYFVFEMDQPGAEVRPLKQMTGDAHFAEVFFHRRARAGGEHHRRPQRRLGRGDDHADERAGRSRHRIRARLPGLGAGRPADPAAARTVGRRVPGLGDENHHCHGKRERDGGR
jgi:alkylation response protein AidB-like acyl-CoA dehydrogenase